MPAGAPRDGASAVAATSSTSRRWRAWWPCRARWSTRAPSSPSSACRRRWPTSSRRRASRSRVVMPPFTNTELIAGTKPVAAKKPVEPEDIAAAIVKALDKPKTHVSVPAAGAVRPGAHRDAGSARPAVAQRRTGNDRVFLDFDAARTAARTRSARRPRRVFAVPTTKEPQHEHPDHGRRREGTRRPRPTPTRRDCTGAAHLRPTPRCRGSTSPDYRPFWAITKHADIMEIERANDALHQLAAAGAVTGGGRRAYRPAMGISTLIHMDDPQHRVVRAIGADWFRPKAMRALKVRVDELAEALRRPDGGGRPRVRLRPGGRGELPAVRDHVDARAARGGLPAHARSTRRRLFGSDDEEFQRGAHRRRSSWRCCSTCSGTSTS